MSSPTQQGVPGEEDSSFIKGGNLNPVKHNYNALEFFVRSVILSLPLPISANAVISVTCYVLCACPYTWALSARHGNLWKPT